MCSKKTGSPSLQKENERRKKILEILALHKILFAFCGSAPTPLSGKFCTFRLVLCCFYVIKKCYWLLRAHCALKKLTFKRSFWGLRGGCDCRRRSSKTHFIWFPVFQFNSILVLLASILVLKKILYSELFFQTVSLMGVRGGCDCRRSPSQTHLVPSMYSQLLVEVI